MLSVVRTSGGGIINRNDYIEIIEMKIIDNHLHLKCLDIEDKMNNLFIVDKMPKVIEKIFDRVIHKIPTEIIFDIKNKKIVSVHDV